MTVAEVREKWNRRYEERLAGDATGHPAAAAGPAVVRPEPNPLALRFEALMRGGTMLDAACGLGAGIAAVGDRFERIYAVDLSDVAVHTARRLWGAGPRIRWIVADVSQVNWPAGFFDLVCAFGFTEWAFLRQVPRLVKPGGLFLYQGFSRRQLEVKPGLSPDWTSTPESIAALFPGWRVLAGEETDAPPFRVSFAAQRPEATRERER